MIVPESSFNDFLNGKLPKLEGIKPLIQDWEDHISTIFTEVRLKKDLLKLEGLMQATGEELVRFQHFGLVFYMITIP